MTEEDKKIIEPHSEEEKIMDETKKVVPDAPVKEDAATNTEEVKEEKLSESTVEEKPAEEPKEEVTSEADAETKAEPETKEKAETKEEVVAEPTAEVEEEKTSNEEDIKKTEEELAVIKEVREELVTLYAKYKDVQVSNEKLSKELSDLKAEHTSAIEKLDRYEKAEDEIKAKERLEKIEKLSQKFKLLGQDKTVEYLSTKGDAEISELNSIVDASLVKIKDNAEQLSETVPSQGKEQLSEEETKDSVVEAKPVEEVKVEPVKPSKETFFANIAKTLANEQTSPVRGSRAKFL